MRRGERQIVQQGFTIGEPVAPFTARHSTSSRFPFDSHAGRWTMVLLPGRIGAGEKAGHLAAILAAHRDALDPGRRVVVVIGTDPADEAACRLPEGPGCQVLWDDAGTARRALRATRPDGTLREGWLLLDPGLRVFGIWPLEAGAEAMATFAALPPPERHAGVTMHAPVLIVPRVFEPAFCRRLVAFHRNRLAAQGAAALVPEEEEGAAYPRQVRRSAVLVTETELQVQIRGRLNMRLVPELRRAFRFEASRMERFLIACYDAGERAHFGPHRDDDAPGSAHRRFAASINIGGDRHDGGDLRFPEYGMATYRAPPGGALVYACSLLHEVRPVTRGRRFVCLPFLFDETAARERDEAARPVAPPATLAATLPARAAARR